MNDPFCSCPFSLDQDSEHDNRATGQPGRQRKERYHLHGIQERTDVRSLTVGCSDNWKSRVSPPTAAPLTGRDRGRGEFI